MITQKQRDAYRRRLEDEGVPEVIAYMAAQNADVDGVLRIERRCAGAMLMFGFVWDDTPEGWAFWDTAHENTRPAA